jgi:hypothetical protein
MQQSPSWQVNSFSAGQHILQNQKVHQRALKDPPPDTILRHINPVRPQPPTLFLKDQF